MATIDEFALKNIGLWWRYGISRHCDKWKYIIMWRIFESEIILIPPSLKISESSSNGSYRNTDEVWGREVDSPEVCRLETCVYIVCLPNLQHLHTLIFILKLKLVLWFILSVIPVLLFHIFGIQNSYKLLFLLKGEFSVVPTAKICGQSLSSKISIDMNSIFMKLYVTWPHTSEIWIFEVIFVDFRLTKNIFFNETESFVGRKTSNHACRIFFAKTNCETMYHWFFHLEVTVVKKMNNLNVCSAHSYLYPRSWFNLFQCFYIKFYILFCWSVKNLRSAKHVEPKLTVHDRA